MRRNRFTEALHWVDLALQKSDSTADPAVRARALCSVCWAMWAVGASRGRACAAMAEAEAIARTLSDPLTLAVVLYQYAVLMATAVSLRTRRGRRRGAGVRESFWRSVDHRDGDLGASDDCAQRRELRDRVDQAASLLESVGNAYHSADPVPHGGRLIAAPCLGCRARGQLAPGRAARPPPRSAVSVDGGARQRRSRCGSAATPKPLATPSASSSALPRTRRPGHRRPMPSSASPRSRRSTTNSTAPRGSAGAAAADALPRHR